MEPQGGQKFGWLSRALLLLGSLILVLISVLISIWLLFCPKKTVDETRNGFFREQATYEELVALFEKIEKLHYVSIDSENEISLTIWKEILPRPSVRGVNPRGESVLRILENEGISQNNWNNILNLLQYLHLRSISFSEKRNMIEVDYSDGCRCAWIFVTPYGSTSLNTIAHDITIDERDGEEGPYMLNKRWFMYRGCAG